jgi:glutaconate CoA-transferase subunit A
VVVAPGAAHPSYADGYSQRDNAFYAGWEPISRDPEKFAEWMLRNVMDVEAGAERV